MSKLFDQIRNDALCSNCGLVRYVPHTCPQPFEIWRHISAHLHRQKRWSAETLGPGAHTKGLLEHIRKELIEVEAEPNSLEEWIDVAILAFDGAWRAGHTPQQIAAMWLAKQNKNEEREWPDWRTVPDGVPIEHKR